MATKNRKAFYGIGVNDADYIVEKRETAGYVDGKRKQKQVWVCPYYRAWKGMLERCYSAKVHKRNPTYTGCTVSDEWLTFSVFKTWMEKQQWEGMQLDKDILFEENKVYSAETCVFVSPMVNTFINDRGAARGEWMIGVCWDKGNAKFRSQCRNPITKKNEHLGRFTYEQAAHEAWRKRKHELALQLADSGYVDDDRVANALRLRYSYDNWYSKERN